MEMPEHNKIAKRPGVNRLDSGGENSKHRKKSFEEIWEHNSWGREAKSGPGSLLKNTVRMRKTLGIVVEKLKIALGKNSIK